MKPTLCVDFDGTIVEGRYPNIGKLQPGVKEALEKLSEQYEIVISSCRNNPEVDATGLTLSLMKAFLIEEGIPYSRIDDGTSGKIVANWYIDDRAVCFGGEDGRSWEEISKDLLKKL